MLNDIVNDPVPLFFVGMFCLPLTIFFCTNSIPSGARFCGFLVLPAGIALGCSGWRTLPWLLLTLLPTELILLFGWVRVYTPQPNRAPVSSAVVRVQLAFAALAIPLTAILVWRGDLEIPHDLKDLAGIAGIACVLAVLLFHAFTLFLPLYAHQEGEVRARLTHYRIAKVYIGRWAAIPERQIIFTDESGRTWVWRCSTLGMSRYIGRIGSVYTFTPYYGLGRFLFLRRRPQLVERHADSYAEPDSEIPFMRISRDYPAQIWKLIALILAITFIIFIAFLVCIFLLRLLQK